MKINILFIIMQMAMGGSEKLVLDLIKNINLEKFNPFLAWFYDDVIISEYESLEIPMFHVPKKKRFDVSTMNKLAHIIKANKIEVVVAQHFMSFVYAFYGAKVANKCKLFYTEHSEWEIDTIPLSWRIIGHFLIASSDTSVAVSDKVNYKMQSVFSTRKDKITTILNGVDLSNYGEDGDRGLYKEKLGFDTDSFLVGIVANLKRNKNHIFLIKAIKEVLKEHNELNLIIVGAANDRESIENELELKQYVKKHKLADYIHFLGFRSDISDIMKALDLFCLTSRKEGLPISVIEAMAAGIAVIGTNVDGIIDLISHDQNGLLVELDNIEDLKNTIIKLIRDEKTRKKIGANGRKLAHENYSLKSCVYQYENLFIK